MTTDTTSTGAGLPGAALRDLETHLLGQLIRPHHAEYESARLVQNRGVDQHPALILRAADAADVIRGVSFAREHNLPLAVRSGGHSVAGHGTVADGLVIDLSRMHGLSMDPETRTAWAQPGATWGTYAAAADVYGLATSSGDTGSVGVGGLSLGGGIGWMARKYGLTIDHLLSVELVTADGRLLRATTEDHPDLFWALRGGGGNFGVATAFQLRLQPAGLILGGAVVYPATSDVLRLWAEYAVSAPDELTTLVAIEPAPPAPFIPAEEVGKPVAIIGVCYAGDMQAGLRAVEPLRKLAQPVTDIIGRMPYPAMFKFTEEASRPQAIATRNGYFGSLDNDVLDAIVQEVRNVPSHGGMIQLRALGGAMARVPADATAFAHRDKPFWGMVVGTEEQRGWTERLWARLRPHAQGTYVGFLEAEGQARVQEAYSAETYARLLRVKRQYDPTNLFQVNQNIR